MSLVRMGLSENRKFGEGYDAIFGTKKKQSSNSNKSAKKKPKSKLRRR